MRAVDEARKRVKDMNDFGLGRESCERDVVAGHAASEVERENGQLRGIGRQERYRLLRSEVCRGQELNLGPWSS